MIKVGEYDDVTDGITKKHFPVIERMDIGYIFRKSLFLILFFISSWLYAGESIQIGMSPDDVMRIYGKPDLAETEVSDNGGQLVWVYKVDTLCMRVYFKTRYYYKNGDMRPYEWVWVQEDRVRDVKYTNLFYWEKESINSESFLSTEFLEKLFTNPLVIMILIIITLLILSAVFESFSEFFEIFTYIVIVIFVIIFIIRFFQTGGFFLSF